MYISNPRLTGKYEFVPLTVWTSSWPIAPTAARAPPASRPPPPATPPQPRAARTTPTPKSWTGSPRSSSCRRRRPWLLRRFRSDLIFEISGINSIFYQYHVCLDCFGLFGPNGERKNEKNTTCLYTMARSRANLHCALFVLNVQSSKVCCTGQVDQNWFLTGWSKNQNMNTKRLPRVAAPRCIMSMILFSRSISGITLVLRLVNLIIEIVSSHTFTQKTFFLCYPLYKNMHLLGQNVRW